MGKCLHPEWTPKGFQGMEVCTRCGVGRLSEQAKQMAKAADGCLRERFGSAVVDALIEKQWKERLQ